MGGRRGCGRKPGFGLSRLKGVFGWVLGALGKCREGRGCGKCGVSASGFRA